MKQPKLNQQGAVAMLSVTIFAIIITIVATAYIKIVISQQRNAQNYDYSTRAYYAAESGVQDAVRALQASAELKTTNKTNCAPASPNESGVIGFNTNYQLSYTCQLITVTPDAARGNVVPNAKTAMIRLEPVTPVPGPYKIVLRWSKQQGADQPNIYYPRAASVPFFPVLNEWNASGNDDFPVHALLRASIITHPSSAAFSRNDITQRVAFMNPVVPAHAGGEVEFRVDPDTAAVDNNKLQQEALFDNAECYPSNNITGNNFTGYACKASIRLNQGYNLTNQTLYLRLGSLYRSTDFSVQLTRDDGTVIPVKNGQAIIDITGRAGSGVFRRIQQTVSIGGSYEDLNPDAALIAAEGLCKWFKVGTQASTYQSQYEKCDPSTTNQ